MKSIISFILLLNVFIFSNTNEIAQRIEKGKSAPYTGALMPEELAQSLINTTKKYKDLTTNFQAVSTNYYVLKAENKKLQLIYTNEINKLNDNLLQVTKENNRLKVAFVVGGPTLFIGGVVSGTIIAIKLSEFLINTIKESLKNE